MQQYTRAAHHEGSSIICDELAGEHIAEAPAVGGTRQQRCQHEAKRKEHRPETVYQVPRIFPCRTPAHILRSLCLSEVRAIFHHSIVALICCHHCAQDLLLDSFHTAAAKFSGLPCSIRPLLRPEF